jgi:type II secretory pathway component PulF
MPLVQSLDILRQRVTNPSSRSCSTTSTSACGRAARCRKRSRRTGLFPGVYTASLLAGEKSGNLEQVLRRYVSYVKVVSSVRRKTNLRARLSAILVQLSIIVVTGDRGEGRPRSSATSTTSSARNCRCRPRFIVGLSTFVTTYFCCSCRGNRRVVARPWWVRQPGQRRRLQRLILKLPMLGSIAQKFSTSQGARTLATSARRRHSAG